MTDYNAKTETYFKSLKRLAIVNLGFLLNTVTTQKQFNNDMHTDVNIIIKCQHIPLNKTSIKFLSWEGNLN